MKKFVVMYRVPVERMKEWRETTSPEEMKKQGEKLGEDFKAWMTKHEKAIIDKGLPLGQNTRLTSRGAEAVTNDLNYYSVIEAESIDAVIEMCKDNPHITMDPAAFIDIMEVSHAGM